jgi:hypothetical protein
MSEESEIFWEKEFGSEAEAVDFAGRKIVKSKYGKTNSPYGWNIDHILSLSCGGKDSDDNKQIANIEINEKKRGRITFKIEGREYQVKKSKNAGKGMPTGYDYSKKIYCIEEVIDPDEKKFERARKNLNAGGGGALTEK